MKALSFGANAVAMLLKVDEVCPAFRSNDSYHAANQADPTRNIVRPPTISATLPKNNKKHPYAKLKKKCDEARHACR